MNPNYRKRFFVLMLALLIPVGLNMIIGYYADGWKRYHSIPKHKQFNAAKWQRDSIALQKELGFVSGLRIP